MTISNKVVDVQMSKNINLAVDIKGLVWTWG